MRIEIIGENDCARATRRLLRQAGFAVTEFLPADVVTNVPQSGYAITIELGGSRDIELGTSRDIERGTNRDIALGTHRANELGSDRATELTPATPTHNPAHGPDYATHDHPAPRTGEAGSFARIKPRWDSASSPTFSQISAGIAQGTARKIKHDAILFDSADSALEAAILRHVTQLSPALVVIDRQGGLVHSERELRIVTPANDICTGAVEFAVLRGMLDLASSAAAEDCEGDENINVNPAARICRAPIKKKWWQMFFGLGTKRHD